MHRATRVYRPAAAFVRYKNRVPSYLMLLYLLPSFLHDPTTPCARDAWPTFSHTSARTSFSDLLPSLGPHLIGNAAAEIHASSRNPQSSLLISMLQTLCDANGLLRSASHWPRYELSQRRALSICLAIAPSLILIPETLRCRRLGLALVAPQVDDVSTVSRRGSQSPE